MKVTVEVSGAGGKAMFVETFYDLPDVLPDRPLALAREVEQLMVAYPEYQTITIEIEKDADDASKNIQQPSGG